MKWIKLSDRLPKEKVFARLHGKIGLLHIIDEHAVLFDCGGEGWRYDMTDRTVRYFEWLDDLDVSNSAEQSKKESDGKEIINARIEENESMLEMAKLHMDNRACLVIRRRIEQLHELAATAPPVSDAIQFAEWMNLTGWHFNRHYGWYDVDEKVPKYYTTSELYALFNQSKQNK